MSTLTPTYVRKHVYKILDSVIKTGNPKRIERKGYSLKIILDGKVNKLANLKPHNTIVGNPEDLVNLKVGQWSEEKNL